ncbi:MAG: TonB-dependent receptor [candidate division KSB1 bacterium]|nr:TonB-dependent receptor [candidate division KSB1 bacterium]
MDTSRALVFWLLLHFVSTPLFSAYSQSRPSSAIITGRVVDAKTHLPLAHVEVLVKSLQRGDVTDEDGRFQISSLPAGTYEIFFMRQGYKTVHQKGILAQVGTAVELSVAMVFTAIALDEVLVTANRSQASEWEVPQLVSVVTAKEARERNIQQTAEMLKEEAGVFVQKTNHGGGSPIIRGLKANKLLLLVDGIRMNNATYRGGNFQYLNTVDAHALERVEVIHGPVSALYGSDALGGAVNVITKKPILHNGDGYLLAGSVSGVASTADHSYKSHLNAMTSNSNWGILIDASYSAFGNVTRGDNAGAVLMQKLENDSRTKRQLNRTQSPNAYDAIDLTTKALIKLTTTQQVTAAYQLNRQKSVPRYDAFEAQTDSIWNYAPQERDLVYLGYQNNQSNRLFHLATVTVSWHRQFERRVRQGFGRTHENRDQFETTTPGLQIQFNKIIGQQHYLVYGTELYYDKVASESSQRNTSTGAISPRNPIYPDGSSFMNFGVFAHSELALSPQWTITLGARFSAFHLKAEFAEGVTGEIDFGTIEQTPTAVTWSFGSKIAVTKDVNFVTNIAQGFRAPNLDDVTKLGPGKGGNFYDVPNPDAKPEQTLSIDAGFKFSFDHLRATFASYYNHITDLLLRRSATYNGLPYIVEEGDTVLVFRHENAGKAYTTGLEMAAEFLVASPLVLVGNVSYTYGHNRSNLEPLTGIPPLHGLLGIRWSTRKYWAEVNARWAAAQERLSSEDKQDLRIPEGGTPGWYTVNLRAGMNVSENFSVQLGMANLFDHNYREHASGFNAPGRNFLVGVKLNY